jgi:L-malate glycosyltransferase
MSAERPPVRYVLFGDGDSPHLLKWARALAAAGGDAIALHAVSSRGFHPGWNAIVPESRRLALHTAPLAAGGNAGILRALPTVARWLKAVQPQVLHAHYLTSHGTLAWLAQRLWRVPGLLVSSAWGSDVLLTPERSRVARWLLRRVLAASAVCTSDSHHMAERMKALGARRLAVFPFGLESMPPAPVGPRQPGLCFSNRGLEPLYRIDRVLRAFAAYAAVQPAAELVVANTGSQAQALQALARQLGIGERTWFVGRLDAAAQAAFYDRASLYFSLPDSDSVAVSLLEAMAHGCIPVVSDLPANREVVADGINGLVLGADDLRRAALQARLPELEALLLQQPQVAADNRGWIEQHARFQPAVDAFWQQVLRLLPPSPST